MGGCPARVEQARGGEVGGEEAGARGGELGGYGRPGRGGGAGRAERAEPGEGGEGRGGGGEGGLQLRGDVHSGVGGGGGLGFVFEGAEGGVFVFVWGGFLWVGDGWLLG